MKKTKQGFDWMIHIVANGAKCDCCETVEDSFPQYMCNAHTHGMEQYGHLDFQVVLSMEPKIIGYLLNSMGEKVRNGERFKSGDMISGLFEDCPVKLIEIEETGRNVLRLIIPDSQNRFPEEEDCTYPYNNQLSFSTK